LPLDIAVPVQQHYQLLQCLSANGGRETWLASDLRTNQQVIFKSLFCGRDMEWQDLKLMEREAETLRAIEHPNIPQHLDSFWFLQPEGSYFCLVHQYIEGISLGETVQQGRRFTLQQVEQIARKLLSILEYLHYLSPPVIHRDVKPSNILIAPDEEVYLLDFGSVQAAAAGRSTITVVGTFGFMPPEQFGGIAEPSSDLYALGATLLFLLTGRDPSTLPRKSLRFDLQGLLPGDNNIEGWLAKILEPDPENRFRTAQEAHNALEEPQLLLSVDTITNTPSPVSTSKSWQDSTLAFGIYGTIASIPAALITWFVIASIGIFEDDGGAAFPPYVSGFVYLVLPLAIFGGLVGTFFKLWTEHIRDRQSSQTSRVKIPEAVVSHTVDQVFRVTTVKELDLVLDGFNRKAKTDRPFVAEIVISSGETLTIALGRDLSHIHYSCASGDSSCYASLGDSSKEGTVVFDCFDKHAEYPLSTLIPIQTAREVARYFCRTRRLANSVTWLED
jgi:eukaryotic-like serine/threonine-protein kinase